MARPSLALIRVSLARGGARFDVLLARGDARFDALRVDLDRNLNAPKPLLCEAAE